MRQVLIAMLVLAGWAAASAAQAQAGHESHGYAAPPLGARTEGLALVDVAGHAFTSANFSGRTTFVYFGYSRCRTACPIALPALSEAVTAMRARGHAAQAVFIDIDAAPQPLRLRSQDAAPGEGHRAHRGDAAMVQLSLSFPEVTFVTGTRAQVRSAVEAFRVRAEHVPPRTEAGERDHSINHTTHVYVIDGDGALVGYAYHDAGPQAFVAIAERQRPG